MAADGVVGGEHVATGRNHPRDDQVFAQRLCASVCHYRGVVGWQVDADRLAEPWADRSCGGLHGGGAVGGGLVGGGGGGGDGALPLLLLPLSLLMQGQQTY